MTLTVFDYNLYCLRFVKKVFEAQSDNSAGTEAYKSVCAILLVLEDGKKTGSLYLDMFKSSISPETLSLVDIETLIWTISMSKHERDLALMNYEYQKSLESEST